MKTNNDLGAGAKPKKDNPRLRENPSGIDYATLPDFAMLRQPEVIYLLPFSPSTLRRHYEAGKFPKPIKVSEQVLAWRWGDVRVWLEEKGMA